MLTICDVIVIIDNNRRRKSLRKLTISEGQFLL